MLKIAHNMTFYNSENLKQKIQCVCYQLMVKKYTNEDNGFELW